MTKTTMLAIAALATAGCTCTCTKSTCEKSEPLYYGTTKYGETAHLYTLVGKGKNPVIMQVTDAGGKVVRLLVPDARGSVADVTVGFDTVNGWESTDPYFGAIIGRVGNRIAKGKFTLDGKEYTLEINDADHNASLHGGKRGWDAYVWDAEQFEKGDDVGIVFTRRSPDGEGGYPGNVDVKVTYTITPENVWRIEYKAVTDAPTPVNLTQHVYFNMNGGGDILGHDLMIAADKYLVVNSDLEPVGDPASVEGTPFDFRTFHKVGERINDPDAVLQYGPGYDHNWCLDGEGFRKVAELRGDKRAVEVWTDQIGLQFYAGNFFSNDWTMKGGLPMYYRGHLALETQHYPNTPNRPDFESITLRPGETYHTVTEYRFKAL